MTTIVKNTFLEEQVNTTEPLRRNKTAPPTVGPCSLALNSDDEDLTPETPPTVGPCSLASVSEDEDLTPERAETTTEPMQEEFAPKPIAPEGLITTIQLVDPEIDRGNVWDSPAPPALAIFTQGMSCFLLVPMLYSQFPVPSCMEMCPLEQFPCDHLVQQPRRRPGRKQPVSLVEEQNRTTIMLRDLPIEFTVDMLLKLLDNKGFDGMYDLVYLPIDFSSGWGKGYAFVNFVSHSHARSCMSLLAGFNGWPFPSEKILRWNWAELQGLEANIAYYRDSTIMYRSMPEEWKPLLFSQGERQRFPSPTQGAANPRL